jgi:hypothetical protein
MMASSNVPSNQPALNTPDSPLELVRFAAVGLLSSAIMHEVRNAMTVISGNLQMLLAFQQTAEADRNLKYEMMLEQAFRVEKALNRVESFSARIGGREQTADPVSAVRNALFMFHHYEPGYGYEIVTELRDSPKMVECEAMLLEFLVFQLLRRLSRDCGGVSMFIRDQSDEDGWKCVIGARAASQKEQVTPDKSNDDQSMVEMIDKTVAQIGGSLQAEEAGEEMNYRLTLRWSGEQKH